MTKLKSVGFIWKDKMDVRRQLFTSLAGTVPLSDSKCVYVRVRKPKYLNSQFFSDI